MTNSISNRQIAKIWACTNEVRLPKEALYEIIYGLCGKQSIRQLTRQEAYKIIETLISKYNASKGRYRNTKPPPNSKGNIISLMSPGQKRKILKLCYQLKWDEEELNNFSNKIVKKPYDKLSKEQASILIEALKAV